jgi:hypothetical protein
MVLVAAGKVFSSFAHLSSAIGLPDSWIFDLTSDLAPRTPRFQEYKDTKVIYCDLDLCPDIQSISSNRDGLRDSRFCCVCGKQRLKMRKRLIVHWTILRILHGMKDFRELRWCRIQETTSAETCDFLHNTFDVRACQRFECFAAALEPQASEPDAHPFKVPGARTADGCQLMARAADSKLGRCNAILDSHMGLLLGVEEL